MPEEDLGADLATQEAPDGGDAEQPASTPDWESDDNPYRGRYNDIRSEFDRRGSELDQYRQLWEQAPDDEELQQQILARWGIELADPDLDETADEPMTRAEFQAWQREQAQAAQQQTQAQQAEEQALNSDAESISSDLAAIEKKYGKVPDGEMDALIPLALSMRRQDGTPGFAEAHELLNSIHDGRNTAYKESKKANALGLGAAGDKKIDPSDPNALDELAAAEAQAMLEED